MLKKDTLLDENENLSFLDAFISHDQRVIQFPSTESPANAAKFKTTHK